MPGPVAQPPLRAAVLVGGASRRMGWPKTVIAIDGQTLTERVVTALAVVVDQVVLVGAGPIPTALARHQRLDDAVLAAGPRSRGADAPAGPLAGLLAALRSDSSAAWIVAACDLPRVTAETTRWLAGQRRPARRAVLPRLTADGPVEPLLALYEPIFLSAVEAYAEAGNRSLQGLAALPGVACPRPPARLAAGWQDVDTLHDLLALGGSRGAAAP